MDKNTVTGLMLIFAIIMGYFYLTQPSQEEFEAQKRYQDSLRHTELKEQKTQTQYDETQIEKQDDTSTLDSLKGTNAAKKYGLFANASIGEEQFYTIENELIKVKINSKGGGIYSVELKKFKKYDRSPLILFGDKENKFQLNFFSKENKSINTQNLYFQPLSSEKKYIVSDKAKTLTMRLYIGTTNYIDYVYKLNPDSYMLNYNIVTNNMDDLISSNNQYLDFVWELKSPAQEKGRDFENTYTNIFYRYFNEGDVDELSATADIEEENIDTPLKWIAFKQHFFSMILIAKESLINPSIRSEQLPNDKDNLKKFSATVSLPYKQRQQENIELGFFFGPNKYADLKQAGDLGLEELIPLGWGIFGWINRYLVIPSFNFLEKFISNYGLIILFLTIGIKLILFPLTYKSYLSTAKMKVLKPEIDELTKKYPKEKALDKQQATMKLYKKAGVNPMGGCLPMLLQMPILFAMFRFFPSSIELRQKSFLWAEDLSSYDSILDLPFNIPFYGAHISLFCLLMTITNIIYTGMNQSMTSSTQAMPGMKTMMYMMPIMFLFFFNSYSSGLSYYYFVSTLITIVQTLIIRTMVDETKILSRIQAHKKKPVKKSKFQTRLEKMAKDRRSKIK